MFECSKKSSRSVDMKARSLYVISYNSQYVHIKFIQLRVAEFFFVNDLCERKMNYTLCNTQYKRKIRKVIQTTVLKSRLALVSQIFATVATNPGCTAEIFSSSSLLQRLLQCDLLDTLRL